jgi:hypothetical protein
MQDEGIGLTQLKLWSKVVQIGIQVEENEEERKR